MSRSVFGYEDPFGFNNVRSTHRQMDLAVKTNERHYPEEYQFGPVLSHCSMTSSDARVIAV
jgi:hypothetical protein